jgi:hypothetical protein
MNEEEGLRNISNLKCLLFTYTVSNNVLVIVQSTAHQTIHFELCTALILRELTLILNCKCIAYF